MYQAKLHEMLRILACGDIIYIRWYASYGVDAEVFLGAYSGQRRLQLDKLPLQKQSGGMSACYNYVNDNDVLICNSSEPICFNEQMLEDAVVVKGYSVVDRKDHVILMKR
jgi:hypothetical protein